MKFARPVLAYVTLVLLLGLALLALCLARYPLARTPTELVLAVCFIALVALADRYGLHLTTGTRIHVSTIPLFASVLVLSPPLAVSCAGVACIAARIRQEAPPAERVFNVGQTLSYVAAGALTLSLFCATPWVPGSWLTWLGVVLTAAVMYLVNSGLVAGVVALQFRMGLFRTWKGSFSMDLFVHGVLFSLGLLAALVMVPHAWSLLLLTVPLVIVYVTLDRTLQMEAKHKQLAEENAGLAKHLGEQTEQLRAAYAVLKDALDAKNQMLQNVSHEMRTPLVSISGFAEALQTGLYGEVAACQVQPLKAIQRNSQKMTHLVEDLLLLQSLDRGQLELADVGIDAILESSLGAHANQAGAAGVRLRMDCSADLPLLKADGLRLGHAIGNLMDNAIKFSPGGGEVWLRAYNLDDRAVQISVSDQGIGIASEELPRVLERFHQADGSRTRRFAGVGLGLAIVQRVVELHGGSVRAESQPGRGSTFRITLPVRTAAVDSVEAGVV